MPFCSLWVPFLSPSSSSYSFSAHPAGKRQDSPNKSIWLLRVRLRRNAKSPLRVKPLSLNPSLSGIKQEAKSLLWMVNRSQFLVKEVLFPQRMRKRSLLLTRETAFPKWMVNRPGFLLLKETAFPKRVKSRSGFLLIRETAFPKWMVNRPGFLLKTTPLFMSEERIHLCAD